MNAEEIAEKILKPDYMAGGIWFNYKLGDEYKRALKAIQFALDQKVDPIVNEGMEQTVESIEIIADRMSKQCAPFKRESDRQHYIDGIIAGYQANNSYAKAIEDVSSIIKLRLIHYTTEIAKCLKRAKRVIGEDKEPYEILQYYNESVAEELTNLIEQLKQLNKTK